MAKNQVGRTYPDLIKEHPKIILVGIVVVLILLLLITFLSLRNGRSFKIGNIELASCDTVTRTIVVRDTVIIYNRSSQAKKDNKNIPNEVIKDASIKDNSSQSNTNLGGKQFVVQENNGIVGDNATINNVEFPNPIVRFNSWDVRNQKISKSNNPLDSCYYNKFSILYNSKIKLGKIEISIVKNDIVGSKFGGISGGMVTYGDKQLSDRWVYVFDGPSDGIYSFVLYSETSVSNPAQLIKADF